MLEWAKSIGSSSVDRGNKLVVDGQGNVYITGDFQGIADFDPGSGTAYLTCAGYSDIFIAKYDNEGNYIWAKSIGGTEGDNGFDLSVDGIGNLYITGHFRNVVDFDPGAGTAYLTAAGTGDIFIAKYNTNGNYIWANKIGGTGMDVGYSIVVDDQYNVYITGCFLGTTDFDPGANTVEVSSIGMEDIFVGKYDSNGNYIWAFNIGSTSNDHGNDIFVDDTGNVFITGYFTDISDFDPGVNTENLISNGDEDIFLAKYDTYGNYLWARNIGGFDDDIGNCITVDKMGNSIITGFFRDTVDFNPGTDTMNLISYGLDDIFISKFDFDGNFRWANSIGSISLDNGNSITSDEYGNIYITGFFGWNADFDPGIGTEFLAPIGSLDIFFATYDSSGNYISASNIGSTAIDRSQNIAVDGHGNIYIIGSYSGTIDFDPSIESVYQTSAGSADIFFLKYKQKGVIGIVYNDINQNCINDTTEIGLQSRNIYINPGNVIVQTNGSGVWMLDSLPVGTYTATIDSSGHWSPTCFGSQIFTVTNTNEITYVPDFGLVSTQPCGIPDVTINMPFMRRCFNGQNVYVNACNSNIATGVLFGSYVDVELDSMIIPQSASIPYTDLGNGIWRFQTGDLNPGQCNDFYIACDVSCNALVGQTLCMQANMYPADSCVFDTISDPFPGNFTPCPLPWDHSSLQVEGFCMNDTIYFVVYNTGAPVNGDMDCWSPVRLYIDGIYTLLDSVMLAGGDSMVFVFPGDGRTWRLEADQHPLHPGNSHPNATVELCGDPANWTQNLVNILPMDDADPIVDIYCGLVSVSYDPNDKKGYPIGHTFDHYVMPNQQIQYVIRFQNTGSDTAFTVIVRDTLDMNLDIFSVVSGVASHNYNFQMYGPRVLEWRFDNILLPDSNINEAMSHGFVTFTVNQNYNLPNGTVIFNEADIYFDFNAPVITNQTHHEINDQIQTSIVVYKEADLNNNSDIFVYPNPAGDNLFIEIRNSELCNDAEYSIYGITGNKIVSGVLTDRSNQIDVSTIKNGIYIININNNDSHSRFRVVITR